MAREVWITGIGLTSSLGEGTRRALAGNGGGRSAAPGRRSRPASRPIPSIRWCRSTSRSRSRRAATAARWRTGSGSAPTPPASPSTMPASAGNADILANTNMVVAAAGGERDLLVDQTILEGVGQRAGAAGIHQRAAVERPPPDALPGPAPQPRRRQHRHRPQGHRLVAHLHGRGTGERQRGRDRGAAHRRRPGRHLPRRRRGARRAQGRAAGPGRRRLGVARRRRSRSGRGPKRAAARSSARSAPSSCWRRGSMPRRAAASPMRGSARCFPAAAGASPARRPRSPPRQFATLRKEAGDRRLAVLTGATGIRQPTREERDWLAGLIGRGRDRYGAGDAQHARRLRRGDASRRWSALAALALSRKGFYRPADETGFEPAGDDGAGGDRRQFLGVLAGRGHGSGPAGRDWARRVRWLRSVKDSRGRPVVAVTGMGVVSSLGVGLDDNWAALVAGRSGIKRITRFPTDASAHHHRRHHRLHRRRHTGDLKLAIGELATDEAIRMARIGAPGDFPGAAVHRDSAGRTRLAGAAPAL